MSLFSITSLLLFFASFGFALFLYFSNRNSNLNRSWLAFSFFFSLWGLSLFGVTSSSDYSIAYFWQTILDASAIFIPFFYFIFVCNLISYKNFYFEKIIFISSILLSLFSISKYYKVGLTQIFNFYWINPGPLYFIFPTFFVAVTGFALLLLFKSYNKSSDVRLKNQVVIFVVASFIGFGGGLTNFFPQLFNIYPFGNYFILLYLFLISYGVLKYKFLPPPKNPLKLSLYEKKFSQFCCL